MHAVHVLFGIVGLTTLALASGYAVVALIAVLLWYRRRSQSTTARRPAVTILKPLCGAEPGLYENLRSFCMQDYPQFQLIFGVRDGADPALQAVERLQEQFPALQIEVVIDPQQHGSNRKISSLINMVKRAQHDVLVMADSDARVRPDYLSKVTAPLLDPKVGLVTCIYHGMPTPQVWSRLGAMYVNEWYMPSVLLAALFGHQGYVSGQTICIRRDTLQAIGGLHAVENELADDYRLGERVRALGLKITLSPYMLEAEHDEPTLQLLTRHELRWMRTLYVLRPRSFRFIFFTFSVPLALIGVGLSAAQPGFESGAVSLLGCTLGARLLLHCVHRFGDKRPLFADIWLLPVRDLLICWVWWRSFFTSRISWRGYEFDIDARGIMHRLS